WYVAITGKNNGRDRWRAIYPTIGVAALPHRDDCRRKVSGDPAGKTRMHTDCRVQIAICCSHDSSSGCSGRKSTNVDALWINRIVAHDLPGDAGDKRRFAFAPLLVSCTKPVPAFSLVCLAGLCRIDHQTSLFFCEKIHPRTGGEIVRRLGAAV